MFYAAANSTISRASFAAPGGAPAPVRASSWRHEIANGESRIERLLLAYGDRLDEGRLVDVSSWTADRWIAVIAVVVAALSGAGAWWQAAEARGAKKVARDAKADSKRSADASEKAAVSSERSADAAELAAVAAQDSATQSQRAADIEARRDHATRRRALTVKKLRVENDQRVITVENTGAHDLRLGAAVVYATGGRSDRKHSEEIHAGSTMDIWLDGKDVRYSHLEVWLTGECPCDQPESDRGHWLIKFDVPDLPPPRKVTVL
jgi:hypothetical protein